MFLLRGLSLCVIVLKASGKSSWAPDLYTVTLLPSEVFVIREVRLLRACALLTFSGVREDLTEFLSQMFFCVCRYLPEDVM